MDPVFCPLSYVFRQKNKTPTNSKNNLDIQKVFGPITKFELPATNLRSNQISNSTRNKFPIYIYFEAKSFGDMPTIFLKDVKKGLYEA
jgi:hypothetical protein